MKPDEAQSQQSDVVQVFSNAEYVRRSYPWNFAVLALDSASFSFLRNFISPYVLLPTLVSSFTGSKAAIAAIPAIMVLGFFTSQSLTAPFIQRLRVKKAFLVALNTLQRLGVVAMLLVVLICGQSKGTVPTLAALGAYALYCIAGGLLTPAWADIVTKCIFVKRGRFFAVAQLISGAIILTLGSYLSSIINRVPFPQNFVSVFLILSVFAVTTLPLAGMFREPLLKDEFVRRAQRAKPLGAAAGNILVRNPSFAWYLVGRALQCIGEGVSPFLILYALQVAPTLTGSEGTFNMLFLIGLYTSNVVLGHIGDRYGFKVVVFLSSLMGVAFCLLSSLSTHGLILLTASLLMGGASSGSTVGYNNMLMEFSPVTSLPTYFGLANSVLSPVILAAPFAVSVVVSRYGYSPAFGLAAASYLLSALVLGVLVTDPRRLGNDGARRRW